ncbi:MAG: ABC transporter permease [Planctomycetes bacterium]|nr:ABC transporter permease [Planctomycetota bacterium]
MTPTFVATVDPRQDEVAVRLKGRLEAVAPGALGNLVKQLPAPDDRRVVIEFEGVDRLGALGVATVTTLVRELEECGYSVRLRVGDERHRRTLSAFGRSVPEPEPPGPEGAHLVERLGERTILVRETIVVYTLLLASALKHAVLQPFRPGRARHALTARAVVRMGVGAVPIVSLIAFLIGFILALQAGILLRVYGQTILIADLVGLAVAKEIAPLLTAVLVAGRSGSSLTAEIGTMKVSEEVDALRVMGVDPIEYLVAPRVRALALVMPVLTVIADVVAVFGGLTVAQIVFDIPAGSYVDQTIKRVEAGQVLGGLLKAFSFSLVIVSVAAHQGFSTSGGAAGVGKFTTRSVVQAIIWIIIVDALFTAGLTVLEW